MITGAVKRMRFQGISSATVRAIHISAARAAAVTAATVRGRVAMPRRVPGDALAATSTANLALSRNVSTTSAKFAGEGEKVDVGASAPVNEEFQAETKQLLDIVINSLYTDKEVFVRELVSNASDALEKARHFQATGGDICDADVPFEIRITADEAARTLTIEDTGIGMTEGEMRLNLGTIARSGSKAFVNELSQGATTSNSDLGSAIIGQFGVGFYSAFMVGKEVQVSSKSAGDGSKAHRWVSEGKGKFSIEEIDASTQQRGTKIIIKLKDEGEGAAEAVRFASSPHVRGVVSKYSNFVPFPILLGAGEEKETINSVQALWAMDKSSITDEQYGEFYRFIAGAFDDPLLRLHFTADAPIELKSLFFVGSTHAEKMGMARMEPGVSLYSRKVLIEPRCAALTPDWLRFVRGVVDSSDIPLNISRESMQDSQLIRKISAVVVRRLLRYFEEVARREPEKYETFWNEFGHFLKEGVCTDFQHKDAIAKLLRFETSTTGLGTQVAADEVEKAEEEEEMEKEREAKGGDGLESEEQTRSVDSSLSSLDEYIARCRPEQKKIYYLIAPSRELAEASPYYEDFRRNKIEVIFAYTDIDDFVMTNLGMYNGRPLVSAEDSSVNLKEDGGRADEVDGDGEEDGGSAADTGAGAAGTPTMLTEAEGKALSSWLHDTLSEHVKDVLVTDRIVESPAIVTDHESAAVRRMAKFVDQSNRGGSAGDMSAFLPKATLRINPKHAVIVGLHRSVFASGGDSDAVAAAEEVAEQLLDNSLIAAGLLDDPRAMLPRLNALLARVVEQGASKQEREEDEEEEQEESK